MVAVVRVGGHGRGGSVGAVMVGGAVEGGGVVTGWCLFAVVVMVVVVLGDGGGTMVVVAAGAAGRVAGWLCGGYMVVVWRGWSLWSGVVAGW